MKQREASKVKDDEREVKDEEWKDPEPGPKVLTVKDKGNIKKNIEVFYKDIDDFTKRQMGKADIDKFLNQNNFVKHRMTEFHKDTIMNMYLQIHNVLRDHVPLTEISEIYDKIINEGYFFKFIDSQGIDMTDTSTNDLQNLNKYYNEFKQPRPTVFHTTGGSILITYWVPISLILCIIVLLFLIYTIYTAPKKYYNVRIKNEN